MDLAVAPLITEIRIDAEEGGNFHIPPEYHNDVTYGSNVKALAVTLYSEGVISNDRIAAFLNAAGNGEQNYIRNFSVLRTVIYYAMKKLRLLRNYTGIHGQAGWFRCCVA